MRVFILTVYNFLLPIFFVIAFPAWLLKMSKRGGLGTGLLQRFGVFKGDAEFDKQGVVYIHAVSVGEVLIAIKLIKEWLLHHPEERILLVPTTATGHAVALEYAPEGTQVIYSPLDFSFILKKVFRRFEPKQIILMESEIWPNMLNVARKLKIPVHIANARLSARSEGRYIKLGKFLRPMLGMISKLCAQDGGDRQRWINVGVDPEKVVVTGSVKFDQTSVMKLEKRADFTAILDYFGTKPIVMALSTNIGEEAWIASALKDYRDEIRLVIVPRHAERGDEIMSDLESVGYPAILRSSGNYSDLSEGGCLVVDSTGELRDWTTHADVAIVGKSLLIKGGQNPTEAIAAHVPVIVGPYMGNFEPLVSELKAQSGISEIDIENPVSLLEMVKTLLRDQDLREKQTLSAIKVLESHQGAAKRTVLELS